MSGYEPSARRPIADVFRATARGAVRFCLRHDIHPDTVSYASVVAAAGAALCFWQSRNLPWLLGLAPVLCYVRLWCNMLDGMVALASHRASLRGEILNEIPDRVSDVLVFVGIAHSGFCRPEFGYWAAILALFTAYVGIFGQAVGVQREFSGVMTKPVRMVVVHLGAWATWSTVAFGYSVPGPLQVLDWACLVVVLGCLQTITVRLRRVLAALRSKGS